MSHPHQALLDEFGYAIRHLVPTVPEEIVNKAKEAHKALLTNPEATEEQIHDALVHVGREEFAYRRAFDELGAQTTEAHRLELVLDHLDPSVKEKVERYIQDGVQLEALLKSSMFETEFSGEERYQIEDGVLHAADHIAEELPKKVHEQKNAYDALVGEWRCRQQEIQERIDALAELGKANPKWKGEILDKVAILEEGWSPVERDPDLQEIEKEIEYYKNAMGEEA